MATTLTADLQVLLHLTTRDYRPQLPQTLWWKVRNPVIVSHKTLDLGQRSNVAVKDDCLVTDGTLDKRRAEKDSSLLLQDSCTRAWSFTTPHTRMVHAPVEHHSVSRCKGHQ